ncbi:pseudouridine synthase [Phialemonium atrogriseum]|uniref:Pseudouridine synthase n=1 Tax=Phialemonium atrogriseum TaxID=1093897 RepID=A0AAJ0FJV5_9PEZI|nr:pseudouridine synthase [Phialemonium atrogriseum]KAK1765748.1 pseudouridine synthase [Phialemonium atrogriseum]
MASHHHQGTHVPSVRANLEKRLGITERSSPIDFSWTADIRKRFTDFLVYEIRKDGTVVHLDDYEAPEAQPEEKVKPVQDENAKPTPEQNDQKTVVAHPVSDSDRKILQDMIGTAVADQLIELDESIQARKPSGTTPVKFPQITDRQKRGAIHQEIRRIFSSRLDTTTDKLGVITAVPTHALTSSSYRGTHGVGPRREGNRSSRDGQKSFAQLGGDYLHCILYKENKDTMDALNLIARMLKIKVQNFGFSGTKDRRAGTVQRISIHRQRAQNLIWLNSRMTGVKVGDFRHSKYPIQLGQHAGNEFVITLKNCQHYRGANCSLEVRIKMLRESVEMGLLHLYKHGFINYFGLQRFGTHSIGTHELGMKILKGDFEGVIEDILHVDPQAMSEMLSFDYSQGLNNNAEAMNRDDHNRARAIASWKATGDADIALGYMPKRFGAETSIIRHLGRDGQRRDYMGALLSVTRGMRQMYIHAYQSYVWNFVATRRWSMYGTRVIEGDLILLDTQTPQDMNMDDGEFRDPSADWENFYAQVRPLTAQDIAEGKYTIFDIVLPTPGFDVIYPNNDIGEYYKTFMEREENGTLDPYNMRRRQKEFSLSGSYRPLVGRFLQKPEYIIRAYSDDNDQMHPTDIDLIMQKRAKARNERKRQLGADADVVSSWKGFSQNAAQHDKVLDDEFRRRRAEAPPTVDCGRIKETWIETGYDGGGKRIKVARHRAIIEASDQANVAAGGAMVSIEAEGGNASPGAQPPATTTASDKAGNEFLLSLLKDSVEQDAFLRHQEPRASGPPTGFVGRSSGLSNPTTAGFQGSQAAIGNNSASSSSGEQIRCNLPIPDFQQISDNPISVFAPGNRFDNTDYGNGNKIAVVLKFQLRSSSYATIVLRELMGTIQDNNRSSRGNTPGAQNGGHGR